MTAVRRPPRVLAFDVFGTVVDWYSGVCREVTQACPDVDADAFTRAWRAGYAPAMAGVMARMGAGTQGWTLIDDLHRQILDGLLARFGVSHLSEAEVAELNRAWHRLDPWPDVPDGLTRLKRRFMLCTLSNGNLGLLANMAKRAGLPWDCILSAEVFRRYKPHPDTYLGVARVFGVEPGEVLMVAAHQDDLDGARACGLQTAYVERPREFGPKQAKDVSDNGRNTHHVRDLGALADVLGA